MGARKQKVCCMLSNDRHRPAASTYPMEYKILCPKRSNSPSASFAGNTPSSTASCSHRSDSTSAIASNFRGAGAMFGVVSGPINSSANASSSLRNCNGVFIIPHKCQWSKVPQSGLANTHVVVVRVVFGGRVCRQRLSRYDGVSSPKQVLSSEGSQFGIFRRERNGTGSEIF